MKCLRSALFLLGFALAAVPALAQTPAPTVINRTGYSNGTPLTAHTTAAFNSTGSSTLVAFVSTHPSWNGVPVSISGLTDNVGNTWNVLVGPTNFPSGFTLMSAIYYVTAPATSSAHTVTVTLTNGAPLVAHVFAVTGSDITGLPIFSHITDPGVGNISSDVVSETIAVPAETLLLAWAKNESSADATALDGWTLDQASTPFLWAESQTAVSAGNYSGHFVYASPISWQTAIVGVKPASAAPVNHAPVASNGSVTTNQGAPVTGTLVATDADSNPLTFVIVANGTKGTATVTNAATGAFTYTPLPNVNGTDTFTFKANDGLIDSNVATVTVTITPLQKMTPSFSNLSAPTIVYGATPTSLGGTLKAGSLVPTGSVAITLNGVTQRAAIDPATGKFMASFATGTLTVSGSPYNLSYSYTGDSNFNGVGPDTSKQLTVTPKLTTLVLGQPPSSVRSGDQVALSATVSPVTLGGQTLTGSVAFSINGSSVGSVPINTSGTAKLPPVTITLAPGSYSVTATFTSTNPNFTGSSDSKTLRVRSGK